MLYYDVDGALITHAEPGTWTMYGRFLVKDVSVKANRVRLEGRRIWVRFEGDDGNQQTNLISDIPLVLEVALAPEPERVAKWRAAIPMVVLMQGAKMIDDVPDYWKMYFGAAPMEPDLKMAVGTQMVPGHLTKRAYPVYPALAKKNRRTGKVVVRTVIGSDGTVKDVQVEKPGGFGFDEAVVDAVRQWIQAADERREGRGCWC